ncbi:MAG: HalD/BesD family halogenase, partial [Dongiaceae bacterium]
VLADGDEHGWHFDDNDFVVSLLLQSPIAGGQFEVLPNCRSAQGEDIERIGRDFDGAAASLARPELRPGTLSLFRGQRSLHYVTQVSGPRPRLITVFSYDRRPGMWFPDAVRSNVYGRLS